MKLTRNPFFTTLGASLAAFGIVLSSPAARAAVETWVGNTSADLSGANWSGTNTTPISLDSWIFGTAGTAGATLTNGLTALNSVAAITFNAGGSAYTIGGNAITLTGTINTGFLGTETLNFDIVTTAVHSVITGSGTRLVLGGNISGTGGLSKTGNSGITSILKLSGTNTYTGVTTLGPGMVQFAKQVSLYNNTPASWTATNLVVNSGATAAFNVGGTGEFTASDIATLAALGTGAGGFKTGAILGLDTSNAGGTFTYNTAIANPNAGANTLLLTKLGTGTLVLGGANTYTGNTSVAAGTLTVTGTGSITSAGALGLGATSNGTFQYDSSATSTFAGIFAGSNLGSDTINQTAGRINTTALNLNTGLGKNATYNLSGGTLAVTGTANVGQRGATSNFNLSGAGNLTVTGLLGVVSNTVSNGTGGTTTGNFTQSGTSTATVGSLLLTNTNNTAQTYATTATYNLNGGTLTTGSIGAVNIGTLGTGGANNSIFNFAGGTLKTSASSTTFMQGLTTANVKNGGAIIDTNGFDITIGQALLHFAAATTDTLTKNGTGTLTLSGANTYSAATTVNAGTLKAGIATSSFGSNSAVTLADVAGAALDITAFDTTIGSLAGGGASGGNVTLGTATLTAGGSNASTSYAGVISGTGGNLAKVGSGTLTLGGTNTYTGVTTITAGTLIVATLGDGGVAGNLGQASNAAGNIVFNGGTLQYTGANATSDRAFTINAGKTAAINTGTHNLTLAGATGAATTGALTKTGTGTLTLTGANTYTGGTIVDTGTVTVSGDQSAATGGWNLRGYGDTGTTAGTASATVNFNAGSTVVVAAGKAVTVGPNAGNSYAVNASGTMTNAGTLTLTRNSSVNIQSGSVWNQAGDMTLAGVGGGGSSLNVNSGGTFTYTGSNTVKLPGGFNSYAALINIDGTGVFNTGAGFQDTVTTAYTNTKKVTLTNGGTLKLSGNVTALTTEVQFGLGSGGGTIDTQGFSTTLSGIVTNNGTQSVGISGAGGLTKLGSGTLVLSGTNTYSGTTTISAGTLALSGTGSLTSPHIIVGANTTFDVNPVTGGYTLASGTTLSGTGSVSGAMNIVGTLSPGNSPGSLATGSQVWLDGGGYNWQVLDATGTAGNGYDTIAVSGILDLSTLSTHGFGINLWSLGSILPDVNGNALNFDNTVSQSWNLVSASGGISGFDATNFLISIGANNGTGGFSNALDPNGSFSLGASGNNLVLTYSVVPEPAAALLGGLGLLVLLRRRR